METELKTLKDLVFSHQLFKDKRVNLAREDNLKIEIIKRIRLRLWEESVKKPVDWKKEFFEFANITEGDLQ